VVFPDKLLQFRPLDLLRLDLFGLAGATAVLAQAKYSSLILELVTLVSLSVWGTRMVLGYMRMGDRWVGRRERGCNNEVAADCKLI
jgi:hypothetical protein